MLEKINRLTKTKKGIYGYRRKVAEKYRSLFDFKTEIVKSFGYKEIQFHWYNYHPAYPMLSGEIDPKVYRQAQIDLEGDTSWRGMFLCSAGMIEAVKA